MLARSNAGFIFFGTMLRSLAAPALRSSAAPRVSISEASKGANRAAETKHLGVILPHNKECGALSVLDPVDGLILDSAPSRLTPDIAARRATLPADNGVRGTVGTRCHPFPFLGAQALKSLRAWCTPCGCSARCKAVRHEKLQELRTDASLE